MTIECEDRTMAASRSLILLTLLFCGLGSFALAKNIQSKRSQSTSSIAVSDMDNGDGHTVQVAENTVVSFFNDTKSKFEEALANLSSYLPLDINYTLTIARECDLVNNNREYYKTTGLCLSAALIVLGIIFAFLGYRLMKIVLFLIGFLTSGSIIYFIILSFTHQLTDAWVIYVSIIVPIVVGIIAGIVVILLYYIGLFLAGGSIGFLISWFILSAIDFEFFRTHVYVPIIIAVVCAVILGVVTLFVQKWFFIAGTVILGSFMIVWGLDYYIELGSMIYYLVLFAEHRSLISPCWYSWSVIAVFVILIVSGFLIQACVTGRKYNHKKEMKGICCGLCKKKRKHKRTDDRGDYMGLEDVTAQEPETTRQEHEASDK